MYKFLVISGILILSSITEYGFGQIHKQDAIKLTNDIRAIKKESNFVLRQLAFEKLAVKLISKIENSTFVGEGKSTFQPYLEFIRKTENINYADTICINLLNQIEISEANYSSIDNIIEFTILNDLPLSKAALTNYYYSLDDMTSTTVKLKRRVVEFTRKKNSAAGLELILNYLNDEDGNATGYLWNSTEIDQFVKEMIKTYGAKAAHRRIVSKTTSLSKSDTSWTIKQLDLRMFQMERSDGFSTLNAIRSNPRFDVNKKLADQIKNQIETGEYCITAKTYSHFSKVIGDLKPDTPSLNRRYEHLIFDINQVLSQKIGLKDFRIPSNYFNYKGLTGLEKNENPFDVQRVKNGIVDKFSFQFELPKIVQISNSCIDYLALAYYNLALIRNSKSYKPGLDVSSSLLVNYKMSSEKFHFSRLQTGLQPGSGDLSFSNLNKIWHKIDRIEVKARSYDLINFIVKEDLVVRLLDGKIIESQYLVNIPYRYYNLLTIDPFIFDVSRFSFTYRELCYQNNALDRSIVDMQLRNSTDGLGLILNVLNEKTDLKTFENELFVNLQVPGFDLNKNSGRKLRSVGYSDFLMHVGSKPIIASKLKEQFNNVESFKGDKLFFTDDSVQSISLKDIFRQAALTINYNLIGTVHNSWASTQYDRLKVTPTPGDLEFWVTKEERQRISDKNDYRTNLIRGCLIRAQENNRNISNLKRFMLFNTNMISQIESDMAVVDLSRKKLFNIIKLTAVNSEISYVFAEVNIDDALIHRLYFSHKFSPGFFNLFNIDISDASITGLNYFLNLEDYQKVEQEFNDKFIYHGLDFEHTYSIKDFEMVNKKPIATTNRDFEISLSLGQNLLLKEKEFVNKFHLSNLALLPATLTAFQKYYQQNLQMNESQIQGVNAKFSDSFEPLRDRWNSEWGISISIGMDSLNFFSFSFGSSVFNLSIPPIDMNNYRPEYIPISLL